MNTIKIGGTCQEFKPLPSINGNT